MVMAFILCWLCLLSIDTGGINVNGLLTKSKRISKISGMSKTISEDPVMEAVRKALDASEMSRQELGERMGYSAATARQAVSQLLKGHDARVGTVRKFAKALCIPLSRLIK
jgi:ribosome-binding protein aMBF1 (putative translation factor)